MKQVNFKTVKTHNIITNGNRRRTTKMWSEAKQDFVEPLLEIKLHDHNSVPEVRIGGNLIKGKTRISFDWETDDETGAKPTRFLIEHLEEGSVDVVRIKLDTNELGGKYEA
ncbi:hypothetical protein R0K30_17255 [Bacillus sp. SIMBA_154]|uniref:hypothetical protein n=1 Tax=Bacillus sp. SIMBA_154 TaxID=3080859 RepID=UPI0039795B44